MEMTETATYGADPAMKRTRREELIQSSAVMSPTGFLFEPQVLQRRIDGANVGDGDGDRNHEDE
ncbi:hypothetical protein INR49_005852 [Caranx melampygus]|nr:hypothetical protein INR49_005852 [Caranx melampygus]